MLDPNHGLPILVRDLEWPAGYSVPYNHEGKTSHQPMLHILLYLRIVVVAANQPLGVKNRIPRVAMECILCAVSNSGSCPVSRSGAESLMYHTNSRSLSLKLTHDGVMRCPWSLAIISTLPSRFTATQEYVVPRSVQPSPCLVSATEKVHEFMTTNRFQ